MCRNYRRVRWIAVAVLAGCWSLAPAQTVPGRPDGMYPPAAYSSRPTLEQSIQARIETAWMNNPSTATGRLKTVLQRGYLEIHGEVPNEQSRHVALAIARENCHLPVTDHLRIRPFQVRVPTQPAGRPGVPMSSPQAVAPTVRTVPTVSAPVGVARPEPAILMTPARGPAAVPAGVAMPHPAHGTQLTSYPTPATMPNVVQPAYPVANQRVDLLTPPPATLGSSPVMPEELHLLRVPTVPTNQRTPATAAPKAPKPSVIARSTQFAAMGSYEESAPPGVLLPPPPGSPVRTVPPAAYAQPVAAAPLSGFPGATAVPQPSAAPIAVATPMPPAQGPRETFDGMTQPADPVQVTTSNRPLTPAPGALDGATLKRKIQSLCGPAAREVNVALNAQQEFVVKILMVSAEAEEKITPRLLNMPELSQGKIRLEIHIPQ